MNNLNKYSCLLTFLVLFSLVAQSQYLCDKEYKVINKQKKLIRKKAKNITNVWILLNADSLNIPEDLKLADLQYLAEEKEKEKWNEIDSLLCIKGGKELIEQAKKRMAELQLVVYDIRGTFNYNNTENSKIKSMINFEFDINGDLIRAVIRKKIMSPFSETPYH